MNKQNVCAVFMKMRGIAMAQSINTGSLVNFAFFQYFLKTLNIYCLSIIIYYF